MAAEGAQQLEQALGAPLPPGLVAAVDDGELGQLAEAITAAGERQSAALVAALEGALDHIPRLLRGTVRRVFMR